GSDRPVSTYPGGATRLSRPSVRPSAVRAVADGGRNSPVSSVGVRPGSSWSSPEVQAGSASNTAIEIARARRGRRTEQLRFVGAGADWSRPILPGTANAGLAGPAAAPPERGTARPGF